jgi:sulfide:quinone oxidoreductase
MKPRILILGGNFAGLHAAFELHHTLKEKADVTVIAPEDNFVFLPSLIWVVTGRCPPKRISFDLRTALEPRGINFIHQHAEKIDPENNHVKTCMGEFEYDYLVIATGADPDWDAVPGLGPYTGHSHYVCSVPWASTAQHAWRRLIDDPGPVVVGATQSTGCYGLGYEMVLNLEYSLRKDKQRTGSDIPITFVTSEPFLGHLGMGGVGNVKEVLEDLFQELHIDWKTNAVTEEITSDTVRLGDGTTIPFKYALYLAPFKGRKLIFDSPGVGDERGFIPVNDRYQHTTFPNIYAAGVAVQVKQPEKTQVPCGVPKTGYMSDVMGKVAAQNIEADILGKPPRDLPFADIQLLCIMDGGDKAVSLMGDRVFPPRKREVVKVGSMWHLAKLMFERYYMWKVRSGRIYLP